MRYLQTRQPKHDGEGRGKEEGTEEVGKEGGTEEVGREGGQRRGREGGKRAERAIPIGREGVAVLLS